MIEIRAGAVRRTSAVVALAVRADDAAPPDWNVPDELAPELASELTAYLADVDKPGSAGTVNPLPRPGRVPAHVFVVGVGKGDDAGWRAAGAGLVRAALNRFEAVALPLPAWCSPRGVRAFAEAAWLAAYRYRDASSDEPPKLRRILLGGDEPATVTAEVGRARAVADAVIFARDLTNASGTRKSPAWFADQVAHAAARRPGVTVTVFDEAALAQHGFGGILAVGAGSARPPRLVQVSWRPRRSRGHVVLVGKGITFDTGGVSLKPLAGMRLMRKDMGGAAAVCATVLGAADLNLPVRVTAVAPLAENMASGSAARPGDVIRHYGGLTTEMRNTDAEGRVVLGDALAYAVRRLSPDVIVDLATLTGASHVALGKRTAALFSEDDALAHALRAAGEEVGEPMWRLPLPEVYVPMLSSDVADLNNAPSGGEAGTITAALYLREFTGKLRANWAHIDMSAPAWSDSHDGPLVKGATGWGVRMLLRWLEQQWS